MTTGETQRKSPPRQKQASEDMTETLIALLLAGAAVAEIARHLAPFGISLSAVKGALSLIYRGTKTRPNAVLKHHGAVLSGRVLQVRNHETYYRAAYLGNAATRIERHMAQGMPLKVAVKKEEPYFIAHEKARKQRLKSASQVQVAAHFFGQDLYEGTLLGWYLNPLLNNEIECMTADGHNFIYEKGTTIGYPGAVHVGCGCYAGPPIEGATMVNEAVKGLTLMFKRRPRFSAKVGKQVA